MQAIQLANYGGSEVLTLKEVPRPTCQPGEVLVRVQAVGLNYLDMLIRKGTNLPVSQLPLTMPGEIEGIIEEVSDDVKHLRPGQRVTGYSQAGYAQYAIVPASQITVLPDDLAMGNGLLIQHLTAQNLLHQATGYQSLLITAAAGGVGSSAVSIAKIKGIKTIIGLAGSSSKTEYIKSLGATDVVIYTAENWLDQLKEITQQKGVDLILESVGGAIGSTLVSQLSPDGTMVFYGYSSGESSTITLQSLMPGRRILAARLYAAPVALRNQWAREIIDWSRSGELDISFTFYPLAEAAKAHKDMENRSSIGRLVLTP